MQRGIDAGLQNRTVDKHKVGQVRLILRACRVASLNIRLSRHEREKDSQSVRVLWSDEHWWWIAHCETAWNQRGLVPVR